LEKRAAAAAACCWKNDEDTLELLFVIGVVDDEGVGERERRNIGDRERDLDEPDDEEFDEDDDDRLIGALVLCCLGDDDEDDGTTSAFAISGRGVGRRVLSDNVLTVFIESNEEKMK
jgi:hypothetical protein